MAERIYGNQKFRFDPNSEAALFTLVGADGLEPVSGANQFSVIDTVHNKVHEGRYFSGGYYNAAVANNATIDMLFQTTTTIPHVVFSANAAGDATVQLFENATFSAAGTAVTMSNHNRGSAKAWSGTVTHTPTITATGTQLNGTGYLAAGEKNFTSGGTFNFGGEFLLKASTVYLFRVTNTSGAAAKMAVSIEGYQPTL